eukprot:GABV01007800.1.p1 GENE.GABV01007800.1~~GABV01007800.1.p1  ORF type:complete len:112 (-),score=13.04 GABV01007800.1:29-364(-)
MEHRETRDIVRRWDCSLREGWFRGRSNHQFCRCRFVSKSQASIETTGNVSGVATREDASPPPKAHQRNMIEAAILHLQKNNIFRLFGCIHACTEGQKGQQRVRVQHFLFDE